MQPQERLEIAPYASESPLVTITPPATPSPTIAGKEENVMTKATLVTSKGTIELELYPDKAPGTVSNFVTKAREGFYKNRTFHRVENWVIQGGDPLGDGTGGGRMPTELSDVPFVEGSLGVARGPDIQVSNDAQFFICTTDCDWLTGQYTNFGKVVKGLDVAKKIQVGDAITEIRVSK